ncbi:MAG: sulfatase-like hydrolase/transferase [SAR202 cluster bacterium]|jgi:arylsulfatase A-like enzyme|nr:sulfatase-like hydrolase/transferase [SAR202 cluster bacterium]
MSDRPNIVFILPDQLRPDFLSCYGADFIDTPNIDWIADNGTRYDGAYSASPVCVPARTALLTGMNAIRNGVADNLHAVRGDYNEVGIQTWPQLLADAGYYTAAIGKMHFYPWDARHGFQYRVIAEDKRWLQVRDDYYHYLKEFGLRKLHGNEHEGYFENRGAIINRLPWEHNVDRFVGREACRFIENYGGDGPFAMMVGFPGPHCPYDPASDFPETFEPAEMPDAIPEVPGDTPKLRQNNIDGNKRDWNGVDYTEFTDSHKQKIRAHYASLVKHIDHEVGEIIGSLREQGLLDNTLIIFSTDHADYLGDHNLIGKASFYESAWKIPLMARIPGQQSGQVCDNLVELRDVTATMLATAGVDVPPHMDSRPLPELGLTSHAPRQRIIGMLTDGWCNFDGQWKLAKYATGETVLFNLNDDPDEQRNLASDPTFSEVYRRLDTELTQELMESYRFAMHDRLAQAGDMSQDQGFGREGWRRPWPAPVDFVAPDS